MKKSVAPKIRSAALHLNVAGILLLGLLALSAWPLLQQPTSFSTLFPLALIAYAAFRVIYELTWNRRNVPTLATGIMGRRKIASLLQQDAASRSAQTYSVVDLGSGRGELARRVANLIPTSDVLGIELARLPFLQAKLLQSLLGPKNLSFKSLDFWLYDCAQVDAVLLYLNQRLAKKVGEKMQRELKPGSLIVSHTFPLLGDWNPIETLEFHTPFRETIYVYRKA